MSLQTNNFRRLLMTFEALSDLGSVMTAEREFSETAASVLASVMGAVDAREGGLFIFRDKPALLGSLAVRGFSAFPPQAVIPLLPKHVHALSTLRAPQLMSSRNYETFLSSNGNIAPELLKCIAPLRVSGRLVGLVGLGVREGGEAYHEDDLEALRMLCHYVALAVHNYTLTESLTYRVTEHLRLLASVQNFYDTALETFANAIDVKHVNIHGHSIRVGRYAASIGEALGLDAPDVSGLRSSGYLHDIGKVAIDKALFSKPAALDPEEFQEMADHTVIGHRLVTGVQFPWPKVAEVVRGHHERGDGSGYPDRLHLDEMSLPVKVIALADTFDAMTSERPYRHSHSLGAALTEIVRQSPSKYDPAAVQALLIQVRRDAVGSNKQRFLDEHIYCTIAPSDVDVLAATLNHRLTGGRSYSA